MFFCARFTCVLFDVLQVQKGLHEFLFKLFFLRYLTDSDGLMWKCSNKHLYVIETLQSTNEPLRHASRSVSVKSIYIFFFCHVT